MKEIKSVLIPSFTNKSTKKKPLSTKGSSLHNTIFLFFGPKDRCPGADQAPPPQFLIIL